MNCEIIKVGGDTMRRQPMIQSYSIYERTITIMNYCLSS